MQLKHDGAGRFRILADEGFPRPKNIWGAHATLLRFQTGLITYFSIDYNILATFVCKKNRAVFLTEKERSQMAGPK
jgi:hypothetical protein